MNKVTEQELWEARDRADELAIRVKNFLDTAEGANSAQVADWEERNGIDIDSNRTMPADDIDFGEEAYNVRSEAVPTVESADGKLSKLEEGKIPEADQCQVLEEINEKLDEVESILEDNREEELMISPQDSDEWDDDRFGEDGEDEDEDEDE